MDIPSLLPKEKAAWPALGPLVALLGLSLFVLTGCYNNNTGGTEIPGIARFKLPAFPETGSHAVVVFSEMHYQPAYRVQEMPRLQPPSDSVPVSTGQTVLEEHEVIYTAQEYKVLKVPDRVRAAYDPQRAGELFRVNCSVCHGQSMKGDGVMRGYLVRGAPPANLVEGAVKTATEGEAFAWVSYGGQPGFAMAMLRRESPTVMPQFISLLSEEERWWLVMFLKERAAAPR